MAITYVGAVTDIATAINGGNATVSLSTGIANDCVIAVVTQGTSKASALSVTSSAGTAYTQILATTNSSYARFGVFRRILPAAERQVIAAGAGGSSDSVAVVAMVFRGVDPVTPEPVAATVYSSNGSNPDSPSISQGSGGCAIISAFGAQVSDNAVTAPTSFLNTINTNAADTNSATTAGAWIIGSSSPFDPTSWSGLTAASWVAATVALQPPFTWSMPQPFRQPDFAKYDLVEY